MLLKRFLILSIFFYFTNCLTFQTSVTLHFLCYELGINQKVQKELHEEISRVCKINEDITDDHLSKMPYLKATVKESLRLHSLGTLNSRQLKEDIVLDDYLIPKDVNNKF